MRPDSFCIEMLGQSARIASKDRAVLETLARVFGDLRTRDGGGTVTELVVHAGDGDRRFVLDVDGQEAWSGSELASAVQECVMRLNQVAVAASTHLTLHAGGIEAHGVGVVFPAKSESGKSTLTAGLVRAGFRYLSDEAVPLDWETHLAQAYPKPISLDPGAFPLFPEWAPDFGEGHDATADAQWHKAVGGIRPGAVGQPCVVGYIVFPEYRPDAGTRLEPISKGTALLEMCKNTFRFNQQGRKALDHLAEVVRGATCFRLTMDNLDEAVRSVSDLVGAVSTSASGR